MYSIIYTKKAEKDIPFIKAAKLEEKTKRLIGIIKADPFISPPPYEKLVGKLSGAFSRRINIQHRLVYEVNEEAKTVKIISMWTHYEF